MKPVLIEAPPTKARKKPAQKAAAPSLASLADELGALEKELAPLKPKLDRIDALRKAIRTAFDNAAGDLPVTLEGKQFIAALGPRALERSINNGKLVSIIGPLAFSKFATTTLKALEANVDPKIVANVVTRAYTGTRPLNTYEKNRAAA